MTYYIENEEALEILTIEENIRDSRIYRFDIYENDKECLIIDVYLELIHSQRSKNLKIRFIDVKEYSLYYEANRYFYYIETFKFLKYNDIFYISFDPVDESEMISEEDQDYIKASSIEGFFL